MTLIRRFHHDYNHELVARWLRAEAMKGFQRGDGDDPISARYVEACACTVSLPEFPNSISLILTCDVNPGYLISWHLSVCCVTETGYHGYVPEEGEYWCRLIFGAFADRAVMRPLSERSAAGVEKDVRHFVIVGACDWADQK